MLSAQKKQSNYTRGSFLRYLMTRPIFLFCGLLSDTSGTRLPSGERVDDWRIWKDLEGSDRDLIEVQSLHLTRGTGENHEEPLSG
jgi:hypothetical protein